MHLVGLSDPTFVAIAHPNALVDFFCFLPCIYLKLYILLLDIGHGVTDGAHIMMFLLLHMPVHALHAHHDALLLAVKHQQLLMHVALYLQTLPPLPTRPTRVSFARSTAFRRAGGLDVTPPVTVRHLS